MLTSERSTVIWDVHPTKIMSNAVDCGKKCAKWIEQNLMKSIDVIK